MKLKTKFKRYTPFKRKIHFFNGEVWTYNAGYRYVWIKSPDMKETYSVSHQKLKGCTTCGYYCIQDGCSVSPSEIKRYIGREIKGIITKEDFLEML